MIIYFDDDIAVFSKNGHAYLLNSAGRNVEECTSIMCYNTTMCDQLDVTSIFSNTYKRILLYSIHCHNCMRILSNETTYEVKEIEF